MLFTFWTSNFLNWNRYKFNIIAGLLQKSVSKYGSWKIQNQPGGLWTCEFLNYFCYRFILVHIAEYTVRYLMTESLQTGCIWPSFKGVSLVRFWNFTFGILLCPVSVSKILKLTAWMCKNITIYYSSECFDSSSRKKTFKLFL